MIRGNEFTIENLTESTCSVYPINQNKVYTGDDASNYLVLDFGKKAKGDITIANLRFTSDEYIITSTSVSCGCTSPSYSKLSDNSQLVTIEFDSNKITNNVEKAFTLWLNNNSKKIKFSLIINKS